jgi:acylphosphatase
MRLNMGRDEDQGAGVAECYRFTVSGRVQGVFFRQSTVDEARRLGISGWVRNLADGRVEGVACGEAEALAMLKAWLAHGPRFAKVQGVAWEVCDQAPLAGFEVR